MSNTEYSGSMTCLNICLLHGLAGRLKKGDQLLKANGMSLVGVSNER